MNSFFFVTRAAPRGVTREYEISPREWTRRRRGSRLIIDRPGSPIIDERAIAVSALSRRAVEWHRSSDDGLRNFGGRLTFMSVVVFRPYE